MRIGFLLALALLASAADTARVAAQSYGIVCRGGPAMRLVPEIDGGTSRLLLRFARGTRPAVQGVDPGTCAWQDRGVRTSEPAVLCFGRIDSVSLEIAGNRSVANLRIRAYAGGVPVIFWEDGERPDGASVQISSSEAQYYRAQYNAAGRCLLVTHVGT